MPALFRNPIVRPPLPGSRARIDRPGSRRYRFASSRGVLDPARVLHRHLLAPARCRLQRWRRFEPYGTDSSPSTGADDRRNLVRNLDHDLRRIRRPLCLRRLRRHASRGSRSGERDLLRQRQRSRRAVHHSGRRPYGQRHPRRVELSAHRQCLRSERTPGRLARQSDASRLLPVTVDRRNGGCEVLRDRLHGQDERGDRDDLRHGHRPGRNGRHVRAAPLNRSSRTQPRARARIRRVRAMKSRLRRSSS